MDPRPWADTEAAGRRASGAPWVLAVAAMVSLELGSALSLPLVAQVGAAGTAWLRLTAGALIFLAIARPRWDRIDRRDAAAILGLGISTGLMSVVFLAAIARIPLGTAVAIGFVGPLTVAALRSHTRKALLWPALAAIGVALLTEPWRGEVDAAGLGLAAGSAVCWAFYILLTQRVGDRHSGTTGLSLSMPIAAATAALTGVPQAIGNLSAAVIATAVGLAVLVVVLPYALEMAALRQLTPTAFGTLMALEPAIAAVLGLIVLRQNPGIAQIAGILLVVIAGAGAQRGGRRPPVGEL